MVHLLKIKWIPVVLLIITALIFSPIRTTHAYYGGLYGMSGLGGMYGGGMYGMSGLGGMYGMSGLGGMYGGGMYGMSGLGGMYGGGMYGMSGLGGMYGGGMYGMSGLGGMYGMSGLGGLYGMSGLGGLYGMSGLGGLYGMSGLGGMYGMSGLGGLYGMSGLGGLYGMSGLGGLYGMSGLGGLYGLLSSGIDALPRAADILIPGTIPIVGVGGGLSILPTATTLPSITVNVPIYPDPSGSYLGTWTSLSFSTSSSSILNTMTMNLLYNPFDGIITGTAGLFLNKLIPIEIPVAGLNNSPGFVLAGTFFDPISLETFSLELTCTFSTLITTLPAIIQGTYLIHDPLYTRLDWGTFSTGRL